MASTDNGECNVDGGDKSNDHNGAEHSNGNGNKDEGDVIGFNSRDASCFMKNFSCFGRSRPKGPIGLTTVDRDAEYYRMNHRHRGLALIFNHEYFDSEHLRPRAGTGADFENLYSTLLGLGFDVKPYHNLEYKALQMVIEDAASRDFTHDDCFIVTVLSHGENGILHAKDSAYKPEYLWSKFTADKCLTLANKPKLFFIQACQGDGLDGGVTLTRTQVDGPADTYRIPIHADFLIAYSTIPGFYSWRNTQKGSWFMQALCKQLSAHAYTKDLLTILTSVVRQVAFDFESNVPDSYDMHAKKQIPCFTSMLTRLVQFEPPQAKMLT